MFWFVNYTGMVKKCGLLKIIHDKYKQRKGTDPVIEEFMGSFEAAMEHNKDLEPLLSKTQVSLKSLLLYRFENSMIDYSVTNSALISRMKKEKSFHISHKLILSRKIPLVINSKCMMYHFISIGNFINWKKSW